ncbi:MAG: DUF4294 domain-containing protein [Bacteroidia bacterium]
MKINFKHIAPLLLLSIISLNHFVYAQIPVEVKSDMSDPTSSTKQAYVVKGNVTEKGDTMYVVMLREVQIGGRRTHVNPMPQHEYERLKRNVKKVYPYAKEAGRAMREFDEMMAKLDKRKDRRAYEKAFEKQMRERFEEELKNLTVTQGMILIKLINRETGKTTFTAIKDIKGSFNAFMYQTSARLFGHNLKDDYDPEGKDYLIEDIVQMIERGEL